MRSTPSELMSSPATWAARALLDSMSFSMISTGYFSPPMSRPEPIALRTTPSR